MRRARWIVIALVIALGAAGFVAVRDRNGGALAVTVEPAARQALFRSYVTASGEIVTMRYADIGSSVMGRIVKLTVAEGDRVKAGQVLAVIDPVQARADVNAASALVEAQQAEVAVAERQVRAATADQAAAAARLREAQTALSRTKELHAQALVPRAELDTAQASYDSTLAQSEAAAAAVQRAESARTAATQRVAQARAQAARSRDVLSKTEIAAPIDGVVSRLRVREGEMVVIGIQNQPGTTLMTVSDLSTIDAEVKAAEADVLRLRLGQAARVVLEALPDRSFAGKVVEIGASALPVTGTATAREFRVVVRLDDPDPALRPGLTCDAEILTDERRDVVTVPLQAVVLRPAAAATPPSAGTTGNGDQPGVFVANGDHAVFTKVTPGIIGGLAIQVDGLAEGARVVTGPYQALRDLSDGSRIKVQGRN